MGRWDKEGGERLKVTIEIQPEEAAVLLQRFQHEEDCHEEDGLDQWKVAILPPDEEKDESKYLPKGKITRIEEKMERFYLSFFEYVGRMYLKFSKVSPVVVYVGLAWKSVFYGFDYIDFGFCMLLINYVFLREMKAF